MSVVNLSPALTNEMSSKSITHANAASVVSLCSIRRNKKLNDNRNNQRKTTSSYIADPRNLSFEVIANRLWGSRKLVAIKR